MNLKNIPFTNYVKKPTKKRILVLHGTAGGTIDGALQQFIHGQNHVATHYILDRASDLCYKLFDHKYYAYHAGANFRKISEQSIGIQLVNWCNLTKSNSNRYYSYTNKLIPNDEVMTLESEFRNCKYFQKLSDIQFKNLVQLVQSICDKQGITKKLYRDYNVNNGKLFSDENFSGIILHSSFHPTRLDFPPNLIPKLVLN